MLNELGRAEYERSRLLLGKTREAQRRAALERARAWFDKTLEIEPENLAAHHNLALVCAALGEEEAAERHRVLREKYRPDDHAIERAVAAQRMRNPAADHAAAAIAIYDLNREPRTGLDVAAAATRPAKEPASLQQQP